MVKSFRPSGANENPRRHLFNVIIYDHPDSDIFCHAIGHENFVAFGIGVAFDFHVGDAGAFDGGFDDVFVKCADNFAGEIFRDGQPEAFFDFFGLDRDGFAQGREAARQSRCPICRSD